MKRMQSWHSGFKKQLFHDNTCHTLSPGAGVWGGGALFKKIAYSLWYIYDCDDY